MWYCLSSLLHNMKGVFALSVHLRESSATETLYDPGQVFAPLWALLHEQQCRETGPECGLPS